MEERCPLFLETPRLKIRHWKKSDEDPFFKLNSSPIVMEFFPKPLTRIESDDMVFRIITHLKKENWGLWAIERKDNQKFIGFVGLVKPSFEAPFTPCLEIGWRLGSEHWGQGFAGEAALPCLQFAFKKLKEKRVYSFTSLLNKNSIRVMEKIGMEKVEGGEFLHPRMDPLHPLALHVLYVKTQPIISSEKGKPTPLFPNEKSKPKKGFGVPS